MELHISPFAEPRAPLKTHSPFQTRNWETEMIRLWNTKEFSYGKLATKISRDFGISLNRNKIAGLFTRARQHGVDIWSPGPPPNMGAAPKRSIQRTPRSRKRKPPAPKPVAVVKTSPAPAPVITDDTDHENRPRFSIEFIQESERNNPGKKLCRYPYGHPPDLLYCADPVTPGKPYCAAHYGVCYVPPGEKYDDRKLSRWFK